jgi:hypothetical protein
MTDQPYTDEDLRAEAARQLFGAQQDPDFVGISEQMDGSRIESTVTDPEAPAHTVAGGRTWDMLAPDDYDRAHRAIDDLLGKAADTSTWAINLGADGLEPSDGHVITIDGDGKPIVRIHFAFEPGMDDDMRTALVQGIGQAIDAHLPEGGGQ